MTPGPAKTPPTVVLVTGVLAVTAALAIVGAAWRAAPIDPVGARRSKLPGTIVVVL